MKVLTNSQNEKVASLLQPFAVPSRSQCGKLYMERPPQAVQVHVLTLGWVEREKGNGSWESLWSLCKHDSARRHLQLHSSKKNVRVQPFPKLWLKQSTWAGCGDVSRSARTKSVEEFKPDDDNHAGQS